MKKFLKFAKITTTQHETLIFRKMQQNQFCQSKLAQLHIEFAIIAGLLSHYLNNFNNSA